MVACETCSVPFNSRDVKHHHFIAEIRRLIANDEMPAALQILRGLLEHTPRLNEILQQSGRLENIRRQMRIGNISPAEAMPEQNRIRQSVLELLSDMEQQGASSAVFGALLAAVEQESTRPERLPEFERAIASLNSKNLVIGSSISAGGDVHIGDRTVHTESQASRRLRLFLYLFVPSLALGGAFLWVQWKKMQTPLTLKVRMENQTPNSELPEPVAQFSLTFGQKTETKTGVGNEVMFEGIPANFRGERLRLQFSAEGFIPIDTTFSFNNQLTALFVRRNDDLRWLSGSVVDENQKPLEGVQVSIDCCSTMTDASGGYLLEIPFQFQRKKQTITLFKNGYRREMTPEIPVMPGESDQHVLKKI